MWFVCARVVCGVSVRVWCVVWQGRAGQEREERRKKEAKHLKTGSKMDDING